MFILKIKILRKTENFMNVNNANSDERLTILLHTFNRVEYLKEAICSCVNQKNKNFNLVIIDNASNDATSEYLSSFSKNPIVNLTVLTNSQNLELCQSIYINLNKLIHSNWVTILCDDDVLGDNFVDEFYFAIKKSPTASCIVFSTAEIDDYSFLKNEVVNPNIFLTPVEAYKEISKGTARPAGVSGFIFKSDFYLNTFFPIIEYPKGFLLDTLLFTLASLESGLYLSSSTCYFRRVWPEQTSSFSNENWLNYFTALLIFDNDLRKRLKKRGPYAVLRLHKTMNFLQFFRIVQFPILTLGYLSPSLCTKYLITSIKHNKRYIPHALLMFFIWPLSTKSTLKLRIKINNLRKIIRDKIK